MDKRSRQQTPVELKHPIWDKYFAPNVSTLERATLSRLRPAIRPNIDQYVITSLLLEIKPAPRIYMLNFIRRAASAFDNYKLASSAYYRFFRTYIAHDYFDALHYFESCLASAYHGHELLFGARDYPFFDPKGTGRAFLNFRMKQLYNTSKHTEGFLRSSQFKGDTTVSMWITNDGLKTKKEHLLFSEISEILEDMCIAASLLTRSYLWRREPVPTSLLAELFDVSEDEIVNT